MHTHSHERTHPQWRPTNLRLFPWAFFIFLITLRCLRVHKMPQCARSGWFQVPSPSHGHRDRPSHWQVGPVTASGRNQWHDDRCPPGQRGCGRIMILVITAPDWNSGRVRPDLERLQLLGLGLNSGSASGACNAGAMSKLLPRTVDSDRRSLTKFRLTKTASPKPLTGANHDGQNREDPSPASHLSAWF